MPHPCDDPAKNTGINAQEMPSRQRKTLPGSEPAGFEAGLKSVVKHPWDETFRLSTINLSLVP
jgi:hypothetical protein